MSETKTTQEQTFDPQRAFQELHDKLDKIHRKIDQVTKLIQTRDEERRQREESYRNTRRRTGD